MQASWAGHVCVLGMCGACVGLVVVVGWGGHGDQPQSWFADLVPA